MDKTYKNRYELKYILDYNMYLQIKKSIESILRKDPEGNENGKYEVISVYYDTEDLRFLQEKEEGESERVKLRLRCYKEIGNKEQRNQEMNLQDNLVSIEVKRRSGQIVSKKRAVLLKNTAKSFLEQSNLSNMFIKETTPQQKSALNEIAYLKSILQLEPKIVISYTRQAFISRNNLPLRITFDENIRFRKSNFALEKSITDKHMIMPHHIIMEIKHTDHFPVWLLHIIQRYGCQRQTFSKYSAGMKHVLEEQNGLVY